MQKVQNQLEFAVEVVSNTELERRFCRAERAAKAFALWQKSVVRKQGSTRKHKKRLQKSAKKLARLNR